MVVLRGFLKGKYRCEDDFNDQSSISYSTSMVLYPLEGFYLS